MREIKKKARERETKERIQNVAGKKRKSRRSAHDIRFVRTTLLVLAGEIRGQGKPKEKRGGRKLAQSARNNLGAGEGEPDSSLLPLQ